MSRDFNTLLIPVESQVREFDGKLLLACMAAEKGFECVLGSRAHIHFYSSKVKNAIYVAKSMRRFSNRMFKILNGLGHRIVAWDEEALVRLPDPQYYTHRLSPITFNYIDHLFAWGESDAQVFKCYEHYHNQPVHTVGNPRIDILRPELRNYFAPEKNALLEKYGEYILINTNFGQVNHFIPDVGTQEANRDKNFSSKSEDSFITERYTHKLALFESFKEMVPFLASAFPNTHFILRPHPSESLDSWNQHLSSYSNITVCNNDNVIPWIMGAKALISNGCTTSIEATILDKPTLGYYPISNDMIDDPLPKNLCDTTKTKEQLAEKISTVLSGHCSHPNEKKSLLFKHISSLNNDLSCKRIIDVLDNNYSHAKHPDRSFYVKSSSLIHNNLRCLVKMIKSNQSSSRNNIEYHKHRFPTIDSDYIHHRISRFNMLTNQFSKIRVNKIAQDVFLLSE